MSKKENKVKIFSALEVANMCGVVNQTAINWIKNGYLKAFTTPGGQYRVYSENLVEFLQSRGMKIPDILLPYLKEKKKEKKILIADADRDFALALREKIVHTCTDCEVSVVTNSFEAGVSLTREKPHFVIIADSLSDITPARIRELSAEIPADSRPAFRTRIIFLKTVNRGEDISKYADLVLVKPPDYSKITALINSPVG